MWWLEQVDKIGEVEETDYSNALGAPRNAEEARLLEELLNNHYEYVKRDEQRTKQNITI